MPSGQSRYIVTGIFESAKRYWTAAIVAKVAVAVIGVLVAIMPLYAPKFVVAILIAEIVSASCFYRADFFKSRAEPLLSRLDFRESLGWPLPKQYVEELRIDYGQFAATGRRIRGREQYFAPGAAALGWGRLRKSLSESAFYTRTIAKAAQQLIFTLFTIMLGMVAVILVSGLYRQAFRGANSSGEFLVDALLFLVTINLLPLGFQYNTLRCDATRAHGMLSMLPDCAGQAEVLPLAIEYQLARAASPLLPTFAFLRKRFPLGEIWSASDEHD